ncbi:MAG: FecR domain-containing protein [Marinilabilia sp.]
MKFRKDIAKIIARQMMFTASEDEKKALRKWRNREERNEKGYQIIKRIFHAKPSVEKTGKDEVPVETFFNRARMVQIGRRTHLRWKIAASVAAFLALASILSQVLYFSDNTKVELIAEAGQRTEAVLPDGSKVWLNNSSKLLYEERPGRFRTVNVEGEVFFDVSKDKTSPFFVETEGMDVKVTGTQFNVRNYPDEPKVEVTLREGAVRIKTYRGQKVRMSPGETISMEKENGNLEKSSAEMSGTAEWRDGILVLKHIDFDQLITRLERWYDIRIEYNQEEFKGIHYSGTIRDLRLDQVFDFINMTVPLDVQMKANHVVLSKGEK